MNTFLLLHYMSTLVNLFINCFTLFIIFKRTPANMRNVAATVLNIIIWNFAGNITWGIMPFYPLFPLNCYQIGGPFGRLLSKYDLGKYGFILIVLFFLNACVGVQLSFQFRWIQIALKERVQNMNKWWAYIYSASTHFWASALFYWLSQRMFLSPQDYPDFDQAYNTTPVFCMTPERSHFVAMLTVIVVSVLFASAVIIVLVYLCYRSLYNQRVTLTSRTMKMQKTFLKNLIILAHISILLGAVACTFAWAGYFFHTPNLEVLCVTAMLVVVNHGTIFDIATLVIFRYYKNAALLFIKRALRMIGLQATPIFPSIVTARESTNTTSHGTARRSIP
ncbi:hypothetical protein QR680_010059 [Steinernema hermaphroditum]|uniref:Uncharacterized protein n=1 Tax=Steinernema hermaphroditum TaxID=289476 RepID=A0AA39INX9_9BILA|nr:hypothetical protein QR680_010059 [Steinernema hermaphroditum]